MWVVVLWLNTKERYSWLCGSYVFLFLTFEKTDFHTGGPSYIPLTVFKRSLVPSSSLAFTVICFLSENSSDWVKMNSQSRFNLHFPNGQEC